MSTNPKPVPYGLRIRVGQAIDLHGKRHTLKGRIKGDPNGMVWEDTDGLTIRLSNAEFLKLQAERRLRLVSAAELKAEAEAKDPTGRRPRATLDSLDRGSSSDALEAMQRCLAYVNAWYDAGEPSRVNHKIQPIIDETALTIGDPLPPRPRTVITWIKKYRDRGRDVQAFVPQHQNCGNWNDKLDPRARAILQETVERYYLTDQRLTAVAVHAHVDRAFIEHNKTRPKADQLQRPSLNAVRGQIAQIDRYVVDYCREGQRVADHRHRMVKDGPQTNQHNSRWEIDHTTVDVLVIDDETQAVIGRPTITVIIDRHTRVIMGYYISFDGPGVEAALECLAMAVSPKDELLKRHPDIVGSWPCWGVPQVIVADNGREFRSATFIEVCLLLGMEVQYTPILKAWYKGVIERFFRTLCTDVFHRMPGSVFSNFYERNKENPPEKAAVVTLAELDFYVLQYIVEVYHARKHRGLDKPPMAALEESVAAHGLLPPPNPDDLASALADVHFRTPQREGILFKGLWFNGPALAIARSRAKCPRLLKIKVDRFDLTHIWFIDPVDNQPKELFIKPSQRRLIEGKTLRMYLLARAVQANNGTDYAGNEGLIRAYTMLDRSMAEKTGADGRADRRKAAAYRANALRALAPEEPGAFDVEASSEPISASLFEGAEDAADEGADTTATEAGASSETDKAAQRKPRKAKAEQATEEPKDAASEAGSTDSKPFDPEEYIRRQGLTIRKKD